MGIRLDGSYYDDKTLTLDQPLRNSCIGYQSRVTESNVTASAVAGFPARGLGNPFTYEIWKPPASPASVVVDMGQVYSVDYVGLGAHKMGGCLIEVETSLNGVDYTLQREAVALTERAIMLLFEPVNARYVRLTFSGWAVDATLSLDFVNQVYGTADYTDAKNMQAAVLFVGTSLQMQRSQFSGVTPQPFAKTTEIRPSQSEGGQWLGRSVVRKGFQSSHEWRHLESDWMRANFLPFIDHAVEGEGAFFLSWRPDGYADETVYGWVDSDINPSNMGILDYMQVNMTVKGHGNG